MSRRSQARQKKQDGGSKIPAQHQSDARPKGFWQAGNAAVSRVIGQMQESLGEDLSEVEIDSSTQARESAVSLGATAVTKGETISLGPGAPPLESERGQRLLAHELTHVVQQRRASSVDPNAVSPAHDSFERPADQTARQAMLGHSVDVPSGGHAPGMQREPTPGTPDEDVKKMMKDVQGKIPGLGPQPLDLGTEANKKIKKVDKDALAPRPVRALLRAFEGAKEDKGPKKDVTAKPDTAGRRDVGKEADKAIHTTILPGLPLHELYNRLAKKPVPRPPAKDDAPANGPEAGAAAKAQPDAAAKALTSTISDNLIRAMARAQSMGLSSATLRLDAGLEGQRDAVAGQLDALFEEARDKVPLITTVHVYIGGKAVKTLHAAEKK